MVPKKSSYPTLSISAVNREKFRPEWIAGLWTENQFHTRSIQNFACKLHFKLDKDLAMSWSFKPEWDIWIFMILNWTGVDEITRAHSQTFHYFLETNDWWKVSTLIMGIALKKYFLKHMKSFSFYQQPIFQNNTWKVHSKLTERTFSTAQRCCVM